MEKEIVGVTTETLQPCFSQGLTGPPGLKGNAGELGPAVSHLLLYRCSLLVQQLKRFFTLTQGPQGLMGIAGQNGRIGKRVRPLCCSLEHLVNQRWT